MEMSTSNRLNMTSTYTIEMEEEGIDFTDQEAISAFITENLVRNDEEAYQVRASFPV